MSASDSLMSFKSVKVPIFWYFDEFKFNSSPESASHLLLSCGGSSKDKFIELEKEYIKKLK